MALEPHEKMDRLLHVQLWSLTTLQQADRTQTAHAEYRAEYNRGGDGGFDRQLVAFSDAHLLVVAANNLVTALSRMKADMGVSSLSEGLTTVVTSLRDLFEHWEAGRPERQGPIGPKWGASLAKLQSEAPDGQPWAFIIDDGAGLVVAQALEVSDLRKEVERVLADARRSWTVARHELAGGATPR